jgi:DNA mismatch repair protein MutL
MRKGARENAASSHRPGIAHIHGHADKIRSLELIVDVASCARELAENALDAGATAIEVRVDCSKFSVSVADNGHGMTVGSLRQLCEARHLTSKGHVISMDDRSSEASSRHDPGKPSTHLYGFRGEALHSVGLLSVLEVQTKRSNSGLVGTKVVSRGQPLRTTIQADADSSPGTRVTVRDLFSDWPVRRQALKRRAQLSKTKDALQRLSLVHHNTAWILIDSESRKLLWNSRAAPDPFTRIKDVYGAALSHQIKPVIHRRGTFCIDGVFALTPKHQIKPMQLFFVNHRLQPAESEFSCILNVLKANSFGPLSTPAGRKQSGASRREQTLQAASLCPSYILHLCCPPSECDIFLEPDKSVCKLANMEGAEALLLELLHNYIRDHTDLVDSQFARLVRQKVAKLSNQRDSSNREPIAALPGHRASIPGDITFPSTKPCYENRSPSKNSKKRTRPSHHLSYVQCDSAEAAAPSDSTVTYGFEVGFFGEGGSTNYVPKERVSDDVIIRGVFEDSTGQVTATRPRLSFDGCFFGNSDEYGDVNTAPAPSAGSSREKSERGRGDGDTLRFRAPDNGDKDPVMSIIAMKQDRHLAQAVHVTKDLLRNSSVIAQVDRKFILARAGPILLCVDQHAADERIKLEALEREVYSQEGGAGFKRRTLTPPMVLHMSSHELSLLDLYSSTLHHYGFGFMINSTDEATCVPGVTVHTAPEILGEVLGADDMRAILHQLKELDPTGAGLFVKLAPFQYILCSKACRSAIMFGDGMDHEDCTRLLKSLSLCDLPFQCAHGRPASVVLVEDLEKLSTRSARMIAAARDTLGMDRVRMKRSMKKRLRFDRLVEPLNITGARGTCDMRHV